MQHWPGPTREAARSCSQPVPLPARPGFVTARWTSPGQILHKCCAIDTPRHPESHWRLLPDWSPGIAARWKRTRPPERRTTMPRKSLRTTALAIAVATIALSGCASYIKRDEFDSTIADLRATDQRLQSQIEELSRKHDVLVTEMQGRIRVETGAHFATNDATLAEEDKPLLDDFARAIKNNHSDAVVTVEGFADPAGSAAFNQRLGQRRAETVRDYLANTGGLGGQVRAVSYGEATNRQVRPGATGDAGRDNRRVSLVVDYAGMGGMQQPMQEQTPPEQTPQPEQPQTDSGT